MISGCAQSMDIMAAEAVPELQKEFSDVTLEMAIPYERQAARWPEPYKARWQRCVDLADTLTVVSHHYTKGCLFARNRHMITQADLLLATYDG